MSQFVNCALQAQKTARAENNCHDLRVMAKKVGSNFFLMNRRLSASLNFAFAALSAEAGAASAEPDPLSISKIVSPERFERSTNSLKGCCSTVELRAQKIFPIISFFYFIDLFLRKGQQEESPYFILV